MQILSLLLPGLQCTVYCQSWILHSFSKIRNPIRKELCWYLKVFCFSCIDSCFHFLCNGLASNECPQWSDPNWQVSILSVTVEFGARSLLQLNIGSGGRTKPWVLLLWWKKKKMQKRKETCSFRLDCRGVWKDFYLQQLHFVNVIIIFCSTLAFF